MYAYKIVPLSHKRKNDMKKNKDTEQVIATTIQQSQLLIDAGLPACTADMRWNQSITFLGEPILESVPVTEADLRYDQGITGPYKFKPAWSLGKLMQIAGVVPNMPDCPGLIIAVLVNYICEQLETGRGIIHNLNIGRTK